MDDSLESMSEPEQEDDVPDDKDSSQSGAGDDRVQKQGDEEDSDGDFDAGECATIEYRRPGLLARSIEKRTERGRYGR